MTMILAVMYREYRIRTNSLTWMFFDLFMPLTYLLLFGIGLDRAFAAGLEAGGAVLRSDAFFLAGVRAMANFGIAINTAYGFFVDRDNGIFYEFLTYPMTRGEFLIGKIIFNCLLAITQAILTVALGVLLLDIPFRFDRIPLTLAAVTCGTAGWFFFLALFALRIRRNDIFNTFLNIIYFVFMFASSMFYPLDGMPSWLRAISAANPLTWHTDILRFSTIGVGTSDGLLLPAAGFLLFLGLSFAGAVRTLHVSILR